MCTFTPSPGSSAELTAAWGLPITLTAADPLGFQPGPDANPANRVELRCGTTTMTLGIVAWSATEIIAQLPSEPAGGCDQPVLLVTSGLQGQETTCTHDLHVGPLQDDVTAATVGLRLTAILNRMTIDVPTRAVAAGEPALPTVTVAPQQTNTGAGVLGRGATVALPGGGQAVASSPRGPALAGGTAAAAAGSTAAPDGGGPPRPSFPNRIEIVETLVGGGPQEVFDPTINPPRTEPFDDSTVALPMTVAVRWEVRDEDGEPRSPRDYRVDHDRDRSVRRPDILIHPGFAELGPTPDLTRNEVAATVTLEAQMPGGRIVSRSRSLPPAPIMLTPIPVLTVAAFFRYPAGEQPTSVDDPGILSFGSTNAAAVVIALPADSGLPAGTLEAVQVALSTTRRILGKLQRLGGIADFLLGVDALHDALAEQVLVAIRRGGGVDDMHDIIWDEEEFAGIDLLDPDLRAEDRVSSMFLLATQGRRVDAFQHDDLGGMRVGMSIPEPAGWVALRDLRDASNRFQATGVGGRLHRSTPDRDFNDRMSSYAFVD